MTSHHKRCSRRTLSPAFVSAPSLTSRAKGTLGSIGSGMENRQRKVSLSVSSLSFLKLHSHTCVQILLLWCNSSKTQSLCNSQRAHILSISPCTHADQPRLPAALVWTVFFALALCATWTIPLGAARLTPRPLWVLTSCLSPSQ